MKGEMRWEGIKRCTGRNGENIRKNRDREEIKDHRKKQEKG